MFAGCRAALPFLRTSRGSIVNIASLVATIGQHHATTYVATKGAVLSFTKALAIDEARHGVRVNAVSPGNIDTPLWQEAIDQSADPQRHARRRRGGAAHGTDGHGGGSGPPMPVPGRRGDLHTGADHIISGGAELGYGRKTRPDAGNDQADSAAVHGEAVAEVHQVALEHAPAPVDARLQRLLVEVQGALASSIDNPSTSRIITAVR